ncbi:MAG: GTPase ObgE [Tissierellia bacterium]|nr:GTPase ObgE [Tissierellia bacterium]
MFLDIVKINLRSGNGGDGAIAWRREKFEPSGGPAGGDGGDGGSIIMQADNNVHTLMDFKFKRHYRAESGQAGRNKKQFGKKAEDLYLKVPVGTLVREAKTNRIICDLTENKQEFVVAKGGRGGRGNAKFANSTRQAPRFAEPGEKGQEIDVILEVKLIADVGLIGLPNVGKSSLLSILSDAKPKIANYHFTTLSPNLGVVKVDLENSYVIADIPGLIDGASQGVGLGHEFLRHVERTRLLCHVIDMSGSEGRDPIDDFEVIMKEMLEYNEKLGEKKMLIVANKMDIAGAKENLERFKDKYGQYEIFETSAALNKGVKEIKFALFEKLKTIERVYDSFDDKDYIDLEDLFKKDTEIKVFKKDRTYYVQGDPIEELLRRTNFEDYESIMYFERTLENMGVMDRVRDLGVSDGDIVDIGGFEMEYLE